MECLVTIGSTGFNDLFNVINNKEFFDVIYFKLGFSKLYLQIGNSSNDCKELQKIVEKHNQDNENKIEIDIFDYDINLDDIIAKCSMVIGHCGAGTVTGVLSAGKHMVCVINETLMDNHQTELADKLAEMFEISDESLLNNKSEESKLCNQSLIFKVCRISELIEVLNKLNPSVLKQKSSNSITLLDENYIIDVIDEMLLE